MCHLISMEGGTLWLGGEGQGHVSCGGATLITDTFRARTSSGSRWPPVRTDKPALHCNHEEAANSNLVTSSGPGLAWKGLRGQQLSKTYALQQKDTARSSESWTSAARAVLCPESTMWVGAELELVCIIGGSWAKGQELHYLCNSSASL
jgi:hypothetical protein